MNPCSGAAGKKQKEACIKTRNDMIYQYLKTFCLLIAQNVIF